MNILNKSYSFSVNQFQNFLNTTKDQSKHIDLAIKIIFTISSCLLTFCILKIFYSFTFNNKKLLKTKGHFSKGHFLNDKHKKPAIDYVGKIFDKIVNPNANSGWMWIYLSKKEKINENLCSSFTTLIEGGTCFGNVCALGNEIIRKGKVLPATELQEIEADEKFPKKAMGFQLMHGACKEISNFIDNNNCPLEKTIQLSENDKSILGDRAKFFRYERQAECLKSYQLTYQNIAEFSDKEFDVINRLLKFNIPYEFAKDKIFKDYCLQQGINFIQSVAKIEFPRPCPLPNTEKTVYAYVNLNYYPQLIFSENSNIVTKKNFSLFQDVLKKSDFVEKFPQLENSSFAGFFVIGGANLDSAHALLLEVDNQTKTYVLYDNNMGFYTGNDIEECLEQLNYLWTNYKFESRDFSPYVFNE